MSSLPVIDTSSPLRASTAAEADTDARSTLDRREFLAQGALAAVAAVLFAACGSGLGGGSPTGPTGVNVSVTLANYPALNTVGGIARLSGVSTPIAVVRSSTTNYRAFSMICPHAGTTIGINGSGFLCPNHGAQFSSSGANIGGQPTTRLFEFTVAANSSAGTLTITS